MATSAAAPASPSPILGRGAVAAPVAGAASRWAMSLARARPVRRRDAPSVEMAVAEERLRFSRDVHDVLGRRLATIAVLSELAATFVDRGDSGRAASVMRQVRLVAHDALAEARELARGYRPTNLTHELDGARSLLSAAGVEVTLDVDVVPSAWHEAAGWVVRESVTNVLRHSTARGVGISFRRGELRVVNDGAGTAPGNGPGGGAGLLGLRERLAPLGATVHASGSAEHWTVTSCLPGSGPVPRAW